MFTSGYFYSADRLIVFQRAWKVFRKFCLLCYKQVIALSPRRIKDKFSLVFSKFSQIALTILWKLWKYAWKFILNSTRPHAITYTNCTSLSPVTITNHAYPWLRDHFHTPVEPFVGKRLSNLMHAKIPKRKKCWKKWWVRKNCDRYTWGINNLH